MLIRVALLGLLSIVLCQSAVGRENVSARIEWYGIYTVSKSREIKDPAAPTGFKYVSTPIAPDSNSDRIPAKSLRFGMSYALSGKRGANVTIKHVYRFPPGGMPDNNGDPRSTYESVRQSKVGDSTLIGWSLEGASKEQRPRGEWLFEVWQGGRKLLEKRFTVVEP